MCTKYLVKLAQESDLTVPTDGGAKHQNKQITFVANLATIYVLSKRRMTKTLIRLHRLVCAFAIGILQNQIFVATMV